MAALSPLIARVLRQYPDVDPSTLSFPPECTGWTEREVDLFVGSGGYLKPKRRSSQGATAPPSPTAAGASAGAGASDAPAARRGAPAATAKGEEVRGGGNSISIGGVSMRVPEGPPSPLVPAVLPSRGDLQELATDGQLAALRWMMQKASMRQDMFLFGPPGPLLRQTAMLFCQMLGREAEYVAISRDTTEADLKQRCEIRGGSVVYVDQPPVRAALAGRVLILEGLEKAERNVLPLLNNLLENREMALEDRRFLLSPERAARLRLDAGGSSAAAPGGGGVAAAAALVPVHPDFLVVALGLLGRGSPLDPPLRSRFAALPLAPAPASELLKAFRRDAPNAPLSSGQKVCAAAGALQAYAQGTAAAQTGEPLQLPAFTEGRVASLARLLDCFPGLSLRGAADRAYPTALMGLDERQRRAVEGVLQELGPAKGVEYMLRAVRREGDSCMRLAFRGRGPGAGDVQVAAACGRWVEDLAGSEDESAPGQTSDELAALQALSAKELKQWMAERQVSHAGCYEKADFLQRAREHLAAAGASAPGRLRGPLARPLPGGLVLVPSQAAVVSALLADHATGVDLCVVGGRGSGKSTVLRAFAGLLGYRTRSVFCYKDMAARDLLQHRTTDATGNTHWHDSPLVRAAVGGDLAVLDGAHRLAPGTLYATLGPLLVDRECSLPDGSRLVSPWRWASLLAQGEDPSRLASLGLRPVHAAFRCAAIGERGEGGGPSWLDDEVATLFHFHEVPDASREERAAMCVGGSEASVRKILDYGDSVHKAAASDPSFEPLRLTLRALRRSAAHLAARPGDVRGALDRAASSRLRLLPPPARSAAERLLASAMGGESATPVAAASAAGGVLVRDGVLAIGGVSCAVRTPQHPELVPDVAFVDIPGHVAALRDMLLDWSLGHHLLLVGNQGVGKNKLADRLLGLLQCEREYVQLHRDTSVQSLTVAPTLRGGVVLWEDSPLVRAARLGRCLVVDEADKAPLEVVCVLKALAEGEELSLADGRALVPPDDVRVKEGSAAEGEPELVAVHPGFRLLVLANRPGFPFLGNDFYRVCGDVFSCHTVETPDADSELSLLRSIAPDAPEEQLLRLLALFSELRDLVAAGRLAYPYSTRELAKLAAHMQRFPGDPVEAVAADVFAFDLVDGERSGPLVEVLRRHGFAAGAAKDALASRGRGQQGYTLTPCYG